MLSFIYIDVIVPEVSISDEPTKPLSELARKLPNPVK